MNDEEKQERVDEIVETLNGMMQLPHDMTSLIGQCALVIRSLTESDDANNMPDTWLAWNWHSMMAVLPQCGTPELSAKAFRSLRSVALCMRAVGFPDSHLFIEVSSRMLATVDKLNALETELHNLTGETKQ